MSSNLLHFTTLCLLKLKHLLDHCINLYVDFLDKIGSNHIYFNHKRPKYQQEIVEIIFYRKIIAKGQYDKDKACNIRTHIV